jgi:hypothetical protein
MIFSIFVKMAKESKNKSYSYILPMVGDEALETLDFVINTYLKDVNRPSDDRRLYLKCINNTDSEAYNRFEEEISWSPYYVGKYDIDESLTMVIMNIPDIHHLDFDLILLGKYSLISELYKEMVISFHELVEHSFIAGALYRKEFAYKIVEARINKGLKKDDWTYVPREQEIGSIIDLEEESFNQVVSTEVEL